MASNRGKRSFTVQQVVDILSNGNESDDDDSSHLDVGNDFDESGDDVEPEDNVDRSVLDADYDMNFPEEDDSQNFEVWD